MSAIPGFLTVYEAARRLKRSHSQVTRYIKSGQLAASKVGASYIIREEHVDEFTPPPPGNPAFRKQAKQ